jgi:hypothetical protein
MSTAAKPTNVAHGGADILVAEQRPKKVLSGLNFVVDGGSAHPKDNLQGRMSLSDKKSDERESLRRLLIGYSSDDIDLTQDGSLFVITHKPSSCSDCTEWFRDVRRMASDNPDLIGGLESEFGYVKGSVFATLETGQRQRLEEIAQIVNTNMKTIHYDDLARITKEAAEKDQSR